MGSTLKRVSFMTALALVLGAGVPSQAVAQKRKQSEILPNAAKPGEETAEKADKKEEERRPINAKDFYLGGEGNDKYQLLAAQKRDEAIEKLGQILGSGNITGDQRPEMLLRLSELLYDKSKYLYLTEMQAWDVAYGAWFDDERPEAEKGPAPEVQDAPSQALVGEAVEIYREILREYPKYQRTDEVLFYLAFNLMDLGEEREALEKYKTLTKSYPNSLFVPDAFLAIGEYYFDNNQAFKALTNYKKSASYNSVKIVGFATYKMGWCYYNVGEYGEAINSMKEVVASSGEAEAGKLSLKEDALKDLVLFFAEAEQIEAAYSYFSRFADKKYYKASLKRLAAIYLEQSKFKPAISTYRSLLAEDPLDKEAPSIQGKIIQAFFKQNKKRETLDQIEVLVQTYSSSSKWATANSDDEDALQAANDLIQSQLIAVAVDYHKEARKTKNSTTYEAAYDSYKRYLELFPQAEDAYDIRFAFAEVKYDLKKYEEAAEEYNAVIEMKRDGARTELSASSMIVAINKVLKKAENKAVLPADKKAKATALNPWEKRKVEACQLFAELLPKNEDTPSIIYEAARIHYDHNNYDSANPLFLQLVEKFPTHANAEISANLILDSYNQREDWSNLNTTARNFYGNPAVAKGKFKAELKDLYEKASFKMVEGLEQSAAAKVKTEDDKAQPLGKEDAIKVSKEYMKFYDEFPTSSVADIALNNAAVYAFQSAAVQQSIDLREKLLTEFPKSKLRQKNLEALGFNYESIADYATASSYFEKLVKSDKDKSYAGTGDALYNAALYREALGDWKASVAHYKKYSADYPDRDDSHTVLLTAAGILQGQEQYKEVTALYQKLLKDKKSKLTLDQQFEVRLKLGHVYQETKQLSAAKKLYTESAALFEKEKAAGSKMDLASLFAAEMRFYLVKDLANDFQGITLQMPEKVLVQRLNQKAQLLQKTEQAYVAVIALGEGQWGMAALHEIGLNYQHLANAILNSPIPEKLRGEQIAIYESGLQDRAYPLLDKAAEAMEQCLAKSYELGIYNEYSASAAALLAELRPKEYPPLAEKIGEAKYLSQSLYSSDFIKP